MIPSEKQEYRSQDLIRLAGYGLILLALFDFVHMLVPLNLMDPAWEFQTLGGFVERIPVPLLGLVFAFYGERFDRYNFELAVLKGLSWMSLALAALFLLLIPLGVTNTFRINFANDSKIGEQVAQQIKPLREFKAKLKRATEPDEIKQIVSDQTSQGKSLDWSNPEEVKAKALESITKTERNLTARAEEVRSSQRLVLYKNSIKWNLGALLASVLFFWIWRLTRWSRRKRVTESTYP